MSISSTLDRLHSQAKENLWMWLFSIFCRFALAAGFIPAGIVKIIDERFASGLSANHPMGHYLEALHQTGYYYTFIGVIQILAAIFLLIPRTVTLGAFLYFPIILNICILTFATRFDGSMFTAPLMTLANLYVIAWNYEKWKYVLPFNRLKNNIESNFQTQPGSVWSNIGINLVYLRLRDFLKRLFNNRFPTLFFAGVFFTVVFFMIVVPTMIYRIKPRNTFAQCQRQFKDSNRTKVGNDFCVCIHEKGNPLNKCLNDYAQAADDVP